VDEKTRTMKELFVGSVCVGVLCAAFAAPLEARQNPQTPAAVKTNGAAVPAGVPLPAGYVIGPEDILTIVFWRDKDLSGEFRVRPDGKISLPLLNDLQAAGLTPDELRAKLAETAAKFVQEPSATVIVKEINSRKVYITGNVGKPGTYPLNGDMNVLQLIAQAGGLLEYADAKNVVVIRTENGRQRHFKFNYKDVIRQKRTEQNITLKPGDTVVVP
jgi:polysaccharide biosynthesis/export protein